jgi:hypothetical protein
VSTQDPLESARANPNPPPARKFVSVGGVALIALGIALLVALRQGSPAASPDPVADAPGAPERAITAGRVDPLTAPSTNLAQTPAPAASWQRAGALRRQAYIACKAEQWDQCGTELDEAARLDPDGDRVPVVQHMHEKVDRALHHDALSKAH